MRLAVLSCGIFQGVLPELLTNSQNTGTITFIEQGLHNTPALLREKVQNALDRLDETQFDAAVLVFGLCSNGICGVRARSLPLVLPRTDDCMGIFLGSQTRYLDFFSRPGGTYWLNAAWYDYAALPSAERMEALHRDYIEKFGKENAEYLIGREFASLRGFRHALFIRDKNDLPRHTAAARLAAADFGWEYRETDGDRSLLARLLAGNWADAEFLTVPPGFQIAPSFDERKITAIYLQNNVNI